MPIGIGILIFILAFGAGVASKFLITPSWAKEYTVQWSDEIGTLMEDLSYGDGEVNKFDLYLPKDSSRENYGLVVYLHAGGFTSGDKIGDRDMLSWLCSSGYVAAGINYTLFAELEPGKTNGASVLTQSNEIKAAIPSVIEAAQAQGYHIDKLAMAGGSAGHALAMIYAYRDAAEAPVPVVFTFGAVGPSCFYKNDWDNYGFDQETEEACQGCAGIRIIRINAVITNLPNAPLTDVSRPQRFSFFILTHLCTHPSFLFPVIIFFLFRNVIPVQSYRYLRLSILCIISA